MATILLVVVAEAGLQSPHHASSIVPAESAGIVRSQNQTYQRSTYMRKRRPDDSILLFNLAQLRGKHGFEQ